jgi:hypothetical protein
MITEQQLLGVSCSYKELGISDIKIVNSRHPFILPGLGESGKHCLKCVVYGIGINGDKIGYRSLKCKRIECPNCYQNWVMEKVFDIAFKIEAYSLVSGDRPAHVVSSVNPDVCISWDLVDYDNFHKQTYRHISAMGGSGGLRMLHPYRIKHEIKLALKKVGYGVPGNGLWQGVRDNALNLPNYEEYYSLAVHDHNIVFPSFLESHTDKRFFVKKIGNLDNMEDIIKLSYYLISHCGILKDSEAVDNHPAVFFGDLHRFNPEKFLSAEEVLALKTEIAEKLHCKLEEGELIPISDDEKPSNKEEFYPLSEFVSYSSEQELWISAILNSFPAKYRCFWQDMIWKYNKKVSDPDIQKEEKYLFLEDIELPDGIEAVEVV